ncbi:MAG TPA: hypothetical protein VNJ01_02735 [Bacteriovoracaceae bacterium]|nr:hypothetical protein [Bacteriovoracaceae bacterium]
MRHFRPLTNLGQTSVEYLLLLVVSVGLGVTFFKKMDEYLIKNPNSLISKSLNSYRDTLSADPTGRYSRFPLRR